MGQMLEHDIATAVEARPETSEERRSFLGIAAAAIGALIAGVLGITLGRYTVGPSFDVEAGSGWTQFGLLDDLPEGKWVKRNVTVSQTAGWGRFNTQRPIWVLRNGSAVKVFTATCPHLGCTVNTADGGFICPCHGSAWNSSGVRLGGPTPRNLDTLEARVKGDAVEVKYEYFKQGVPEKTQLS